MTRRILLVTLQCMSMFTWVSNKIWLVCEVENSLNAFVGAPPQQPYDPLPSQQVSSSTTKALQFALDGYDKYLIEYKDLKSETKLGEGAYGQVASSLLSLPLFPFLSLLLFPFFSFLVWEHKLTSQDSPYLTLLFNNILCMHKQQVWKGSWHAQNVAIKMIKQDAIGGGEEAMKDFINEALLMM